MSQHDFQIANQSFPATRADLNLALLAAVSNSSGADAPTTTYANQFWYETDTNILYIRSEANDAWIVALTLDAALTSTNNELNKLTDATVSTAELNKLTGATVSTDELNKLTGATVSTAELNQLDAITRGSLLYGDASGATARLAKGSASTVLTSDGTDISWAATAGIPTAFGAVNTYAWCGRAANSTLLEGASVAGSLLKYAGSESTSAYNDNTAMQISGTSPSGTWKVMGNASHTGRYPATLVLRIS